MHLWASILIRNERQQVKDTLEEKQRWSRVGKGSREGRARGYAARTEARWQRVAANPHWHLRFWGPKHSTNPWARLHPAAESHQEHCWQRRGRILCTSSGAVLPQQPLCLQERPGRVWRKWRAFSWTGSKLTHTIPTIPPHGSGCQSLSSELRTRHVPCCSTSWLPWRVSLSECHKCSAMNGQPGPRHPLGKSPWPDA